MKKKIKELSQSGVFTRVVLPIILIVILGAIAWATFKKPAQDNLSIEEAKIKTEEFINTNLMSPGSTATIESITEEYGLYKVEVDIVSDVVESYITKDGKIFFPQAFDVEEMSGGADGADSANNTPAAQAVDIPKSETPSVELFVMSHCPFGTQAEKGMLPVVETLGDKIDFELKFVDYAMHNQVELDEQMVQYCIQEEQSDKFIPYLECFLVEGDTSSCLAETNINEGSLESCVENVDTEFSITSNFENNVGFKGSYPGFNIHKEENTKYGVAGSPTLVINETKVESARDPQSLLDTVCGAFEEAPEECSTDLPSETPAPGFGTGTTAANPNTAAAACN